MDTNNEKRNSSQGIDQKLRAEDGRAPGVGGRHEDHPPSGLGGGYLNNCTVLNFRPPEKKRDPRLEELKQMGLQRSWLEVAEQIGVDNFLKVWRVLGNDPSNYGDDGRLLIPLRAYSSYLRFQRNRYIESLDALGYSPQEIRQKLQKQLCENISIRHISRIASKG